MATVTSVREPTAIADKYQICFRAIGSTALSALMKEVRQHIPQASSFVLPITTAKTHSCCSILSTNASPTVSILRTSQYQAHCSGLRSEEVPVLADGTMAYGKTHLQDL